MTVMPDRVVLSVIGLLSAAIVAAVGYLLLGHDPGAGAPGGVAALPVLNATLNATAAVLLGSGWVLIRRGRVAAHRACMLSAVAVSTAFLEEHPDLADILNPLMAALTTENLTELNGRIAVDREKPEDVAADFLSQNGLL